MKAAPTHSGVLAGFALSVVAGMLVLINGAVWFTMGPLVESFLKIRFPFLVLGVMAVVFAVILFIGAFLIYIYKKESVGGRIILVTAIFSMGVGGGFVLGSLCGILAGIFTLLKR